MKGKQNNKEPLTKDLKNERFHFLIKGTGYILLYGAILIFISSLIVVFCNSDKLFEGYPHPDQVAKIVEIIGFVLFAIWIIIGPICILYGKYNHNVFTKVFWINLFYNTKSNPSEEKQLIKDNSKDIHKSSTKKEK